jgi:sigma-B regulation protein RsbU (phosphoserine phosphatase)
MEYAYPPGSKETLQIEMGSDGEQLTFIISDHGVPFDPTKQAEADTTLSVEERAIGGLGIHLVRQIMDVISYERINGFNVLTLKKKLLTT